MHVKSIFLLAAFSVQGGVLPLPSVQHQTSGAIDNALDVRGLLGAARGVPPGMCALASDGVSNGGWNWDAPSAVLHSEIRGALRNLRSVEINDDQGRALLDGLSSDDDCVRHLAGTLIGRSGDRSFLPPLVTRLGASAPADRAGAARVLGLLADRRAVDPLVAKLRDDNASVRANSAWALGRIGDRGATAQIASLLHDSDMLVRLSSVTALGELPNTDNVEALLRVLKS